MTHEVTDKIEKFFSQYRERNYSKGQVLILSGDSTDSVYNLVEGVVKQYDVTYRGDEIILNIFKPPAFFPMSLVINKTENPYIYEAETDIIVRKAPNEDVINFLKANSDVLFDLLGRVYKGVDGILGRMAHLMASSAKGRLMYEILIELQRFGESMPDGSQLIKISEKELGSRAGLSRETVSREMSKLIKDALLSVKPGHITIHDSDKFRHHLSRVI